MCAFGIWSVALIIHVLFGLSNVQDGKLIKRAEGTSLAEELEKIFRFTFLVDWIWRHNSLPASSCTQISRHYEVLDRSD